MEPGRLAPAKDVSMSHPNLVFLAVVLASYGLIFNGLQRSRLLAGPRIFFQAVCLAGALTAIAHQVRLL